MAGLTADAAAEGRGTRLRRLALRAPRLIMSWEDWFTLVPALITYTALAVAIQQAQWVRDFPSLAPTVIGGMVVGLAAARARAPQWLVQPAALLLGLALVMTAAQPYAAGDAFTDRVADLVARMREWVAVVRAGDVSTDNFPFVLLVHGMGAIGAYAGAWAIFRWRNPWLAVAPAGSGLLAIIATTEGRPSGAFLMFSIGALLLVARLHLQRSLAGWDRERVDRPEWLSAQAAQLAVALTAVMVLVAWQLPIGRQAAATERALSAVASPFQRLADPVEGLFANLAGGGGNFHKFGTTLAIRGDVALGSRVLFEARGNYLTGLVRGTSYDRYTGAGWKATDRAETETSAGEAVTASVEARAYRERAVTELDVTVFDDEDALFSTGTPLGANIDARADLPRSFAGDIERLRARHGFRNGDRYRMLGSVSLAAPEQLRADAAPYPAWVRDRYLQLPDDLPERVATEAAAIGEEAGAANPHDLALAIQERLRGFETDFGVPSAPSRRDAVDYLLFDLQRGYFDYFATAMAVMLRTQGVPARIAVGYLLDPADLSPDGTFAVRKNDAYSWVEVFFPTYGWVEFLPGEVPVLLGEGPGLLAGGTGELLPELPLDELPLETLTGEDAAAILDALLTPAPPSDGGPPRALFWGIGGALAAMAAALMGGRLAWLWSLRGLRGMPRQWGGVERLAGWAGLRARESESARRWSERLGEALGRPDEAAALGAAFEEARYGPPDLERAGADDTADAYRVLRNALAARLVGRGRRARPEPDGNADAGADGAGDDHAG